MVAPTIYFITGASGVGKTTLLKQLESRHKSKPWAFHYFDKIGVPSLEEMTKNFGSPARWQQAKTHEWIDKLVTDEDNSKIFLEGQVNLEFIQKGFEKHNFRNYQIILIDCSEEEMRRRLVNERKQPELFNVNMTNWLKFLRKQAQELNTTIIDSSSLSKEELLSKFEEAIGLDS